MSGNIVLDVCVSGGRGHSTVSCHPPLPSFHITHAACIPTGFQQYAPAPPSAASAASSTVGPAGGCTAASGTVGSTDSPIGDIAGSGGTALPPGGSSSPIHPGSSSSLQPALQYLAGSLAVHTGMVLPLLASHNTIRLSFDLEEGGYRSVGLLPCPPALALNAPLHWGGGLQVLCPPALLSTPRRGTAGTDSCLHPSFNLRPPLLPSPSPPPATPLHLP